MIRIAIIAITMFVLGIASFAGVRHYTSADASGEVTVHDADVDWSGNVDLRDPLASLQYFGAQVTGGRPVEEQNVDANGYIRVHDPGTSRTIPVVENVTLTTDGQTSLLGEWIDVRDCQSLTLYAQATSLDANIASYLGQWFFFRLQYSLDGQNAFTADTDIYAAFPGSIDLAPSAPAGFVTSQIARSQWNSPEAQGPSSPFVRLQQFNDVNGPDANLSASLHCKR